MRTARWMAILLALVCVACASEQERPAEQDHAASASERLDEARLPEVRYYSLSDT